MSSSRLNLLTITAGFLMLTVSVAHAGVSVQGTPEFVRIEAENASIEDVLHALSDAYGLTYRSNIPLGKQVTGTYDGPLSKVLTRVLSGSNFVLTQNGKTLQLVITSTAGSQATVGSVFPMPSPAPVTSPSPTPQLPVGLLGLFPPPPPTLAPSARSN